MRKASKFGLVLTFAALMVTGFLGLVLKQATNEAGRAVMLVLKPSAAIAAPLLYKQVDRKLKGDRSPLHPMIPMYRGPYFAIYDPAAIL